MCQWLCLLLHLCSPLYVEDILSYSACRQYIVCFLFLLLAVVPSPVQPVADAIAQLGIKEANLIVDDEYVLIVLEPKDKLERWSKTRVWDLHLRPLNQELASLMNSRSVCIPFRLSAQIRNTSRDDKPSGMATDGHMHGKPKSQKWVLGGTLWETPTFHNYNAAGSLCRTEPPHSHDSECVQTAIGVTLLHSAVFHLLKSYL